jgi:hypothetical protein
MIHTLSLPDALQAMLGAFPSMQSACRCNLVAYTPPIVGSLPRWSRHIAGQGIATALEIVCLSVFSKKKEVE